MVIKPKESNHRQRQVQAEVDYAPSQEYKDIMKALQELRQLLA